jgi:DNA (cytosine-5)-methyltransferase 1
MSIGINEACRALGLTPRHIFASDIQPVALATYLRNFSPEHADGEPIERSLNGAFGDPLTLEEKRLRRALGQIDIAVGGPPCQGHSNLNNHTRRGDPKNSLYERMARFAEVVKPTHLIIENVPGVKHDRGKVFDTTIAELRSLGYSVDWGKMRAESIGVPQRRHRAVVVASKSPVAVAGFIDSLMVTYMQPRRSVAWAIEDLLDVTGNRPLDSVTKLSGESQSRIDWMFDNDQYDLPDQLRPDCHRLKTHSYKAVYGRLYWDEPAWTITTGFQVMGQGRFLHPKKRRVITSHEAARLQFFPDYFDFGTTNRKWYAKMIGNAVPSKLAYVLALELLR